LISPKSSIGARAAGQQQLEVRSQNEGSSAPTSGGTNGWQTLKTILVLSSFYENKTKQNKQNKCRFVDTNNKQPTMDPMEESQILPARPRSLSPSKRRKIDNPEDQFAGFMIDDTTPRNNFFKAKVLVSSFCFTPSPDTFTVLPQGLRGSRC
jgi:hypothetical protein